MPLVNRYLDVNTFLDDVKIKTEHCMKYEFFHIRTESKVLSLHGRIVVRENPYYYRFYAE